MPRCPNCETMVSLEMGEIEGDEVEYNDGKLSGSVRIIRVCTDCGEEMKEATFEVDQDVEELVCAKKKGDHEVISNEVEWEAIEESGGRYKKSYYGASGTFHLKCSCGEVTDVTWSDKVAASDMEDLV